MWKNQPFAVRLGCALSGLRQALRTGRSLQFQAGAFVAALTGLIVLRPPAVWWALILLASAAVLTAELLNTALEELADHLHPQMHARIRLVKDCAAAAVLVAAAAAIGVALAFAAYLLGR